MKNSDDFIERNIAKIKAEGKRDVFFGHSYIQRLCGIGYNQACHTIERCLEIGIIERDPGCKWQYALTNNNNNTDAHYGGNGGW